MNTAGDWADTLAEKILGSHCACYAEAWPAHTCANEVAEVANLIRAFFAASRLVVAPEEPTQAMHDAARDWSYKVYGKPIGIDASLGCYRAMIAAIAAAKTPG